MPPASKVNEVLPLDFVSDALVDRRRLRILATVDDFIRASPGILAHSSILARGVTAFLDQIGSI